MRNIEVELKKRFLFWAERRKNPYWPNSVWAISRDAQKSPCLLACPGSYGMCSQEQTDQPVTDASFRQNDLHEEEPEISGQEKKPPKQRKNWVRRGIVVAAVLAVCIALTAFLALGQSSEATPENMQMNLPLQQAMAQTGERLNVVPTWIPDGFALTRLDVDENPAQRVYIAFYTKDEQRLSISVRTYYEGNPERYEISQESIETYHKAGVDYYIISNCDSMGAVWFQDDYECHLTGNITVEEVKKMIDSIPNP